MWLALGGNVSTDLLDDRYEYNLLCSPLVDDEIRSLIYQY